MQTSHDLGHLCQPEREPRWWERALCAALGHRPTWVGPPPSGTATPAYQCQRCTRRVYFWRGEPNGWRLEPQPYLLKPLGYRPPRSRRRG